MVITLQRSSFGCARLLESVILVENMYCFLLQDLRQSSLYELISRVDFGPRSIFLTIVCFSLGVMFTINFLLLRAISFCNSLVLLNDQDAIAVLNEFSSMLTESQCQVMNLQPDTENPKTMLSY